MEPTEDEIDAAERQFLMEEWERQQKIEEDLMNGPGGHWDTMIETYYDYHN